VENVCCRRASAELILIGFFVGAPKEEAKKGVYRTNIPLHAEKLVLSCCGGSKW